MTAPRTPPLDIVLLGLSITSSWGNGHATTYRGLVRELSARGHRVLFLERDVPWYAGNRDMPSPPWGRTQLYRSVDDLRARFEPEVRHADLVIVGSYVPQGIAVGEWVTSIAGGVAAFYDIDTPVTLAGLARGGVEYLSRELIPRYHLYLSFTGGPTLKLLEEQLGSPMARPLFCSVDESLHHPEAAATRWDLAYMGTYSDDRQASLDRLLLDPSRQWVDGRFAVVGPGYPAEVQWPPNVERIIHLPPAGHRGFYASQRFTLNITRAPMIAAGWSPSVRLFEAAACATPIITDHWPGLESLFAPNKEIFVASTGRDVLALLRELPESERLAVGKRARARVLREHTAAHRALELEGHVAELLAGRVT